MTESSDHSRADWYRDPGVLLGELQRGQLTTSRIPLVAGYDDVREIRRGGQGQVLSAFHRSMKRRVAIKVLLDRAWASEAGHRRFEREIDLVATLQHPNIVRVYDRGTTADGKQYFSMEYIDGVPLDEHVKAAREPGNRRNGSRPDHILRLFAKICAAVSFAHQKGVIHRDLKPSNILIDAEGEPHVLDFGLAKTIGQAAEPAATLTGEFAGTLAYASPEQLAGDPSQIDTRTDVYALGTILYEMLADRRPFSTAVPIADLIQAVTHSEPDPPSMHAGAWADEETDTIALKALAKDPNRRYQSAAALREDVERYLQGEAIEAKRDSRWYVLKKTLRRYKLAVTAAILFVALVSAFGITMTLMYRRAVSAEALAQDQAVKARSEAQKAALVGGFLERMLSSVDPSDSGRDVLVRDILDDAAERLDSEWHEEPRAKAALHDAIGNAYRSLGLYDEAETQLRAALTIMLELPDTDETDTAAALSNLAAVQGSRAALEEAEQLYREALNIYRDRLDPEDPRLVLALNNLGGILHQAGRPAEAAPLYDEAVRINEHRFGDEAHPDMAFSLVLLAGLRHLEGDNEEAEALARRALVMFTELLGDEHPTVAYCQNLLALSLQRLGRHDDAEPLFRHALATRRTQLGDDHPDVANSLYNLASFLHATGRKDEAEQRCRSALDIQRRFLSEAHPDLGRSLLLLAEILLDRSDPSAAEPLLHEALAVFSASQGDSGKLTQQTLHQLIRLYETEDSPEKAAEYRDRLHPPTNPSP